MRRFVKRWLMVFGVICSFLLLGAGNVHATTGQVTVWLQVMDSCKQALPGANFTLVAPDGTNYNAGPSAGTKRVKVASGNCPLPRGNCQLVSTGCVSWTIMPPISGTDTYTIQENSTYDAMDGFFENPPGITAFTGFVPCNGGSACKSQSATFTITSTGVVSSVTTNIFPDGKSSMYPAVGMAAGTLTDPIVFHNFQLGNGSCDGDSDADDHLTGSPSSHCDNEHD